MLIRRIFHRWQLIAVVALPIWLAIGWALFGGGGWGTLGLVVVVPVSFVTLGIIALLINVRPTVREQRALSWTDVGVLAGLHLAMIGTGFYGASATIFGVFAILFAIAAFWIAVWQLVNDGAKRVQASMAEFERLAGQQGAQQSPDASGARRPPGDDDGDVIIVREVRD